MKNPIKKISRLINDFGKTNAILYLLSKALSVPSGRKVQLERYFLVAQPVQDKPFLPPGKGKNSTISELTPAHPLLSQLPRPAEVIADRFAQGAFCLALVKEDQVQAFIWLIRRQYNEDVALVRYLLPERANTVWDFDVYVAPPYRLGFTFLKLWDAAYAHLRSMGVQWSISRISAFNKDSLSSHIRLGAKTFASVTFLKIGSLQILFSSLHPWLHVSLGKNCPEIRIPDNFGQN